jgi:hypothetical protein
MRQIHPSWFLVPFGTKAREKVSLYMYFCQNRVEGHAYSEAIVWRYPPVPRWDRCGNTPSSQLSTSIWYRQTSCPGVYFYRSVSDLCKTDAKA